jgi:hypothetical protein
VPRSGSAYGEPTTPLCQDRGPGGVPSFGTVTHRKSSPCTGLLVTSARGGPVRPYPAAAVDQWEIAVMDRAPRPARRPLRFVGIAGRGTRAPGRTLGFRRVTADPEGPTVSFVATGAVPLRVRFAPQREQPSGEGRAPRSYSPTSPDTTAALTVGGERWTISVPARGRWSRSSRASTRCGWRRMCVVVIGTDAVVVSVLTWLRHAREREPHAVRGVADHPGRPCLAGTSAAGPRAARPFRPARRRPVPGRPAVRPAQVRPVGPVTPVDDCDGAGPPGRQLGGRAVGERGHRRATDPAGDPRDPKGGRLLAVIAAICVIGVTAAIIRAIVSQRTTSAVSP